jgi:hypothetical protein
VCGRASEDDPCRKGEPKVEPEVEKKMISRLRSIFRRQDAASRNPGLAFDRPMVLFQSDDWGRAGVRDRAGWDELVAKGLDLGKNPYDAYSLETADDLDALRDVLRKHRDSVGRHPCIGMNFVMANVDFSRSLEEENSIHGNRNEIPLRPLTEGFPSPWERPGLMEAYQQGIREGIFYPALHGLTHFCLPAVRRELAANAERRTLLRTLWTAGTPYIHWRMPWVGYEYWDPSLAPDSRFLPLADQSAAINRAAEIYRAIFARIPLSACAPGYRANADTVTAWFEQGVRVVQCGPGDRSEPSLNDQGMLLTFRNLEMEPATQSCERDKLVTQANEYLKRGVPVVVSVHSINFHSSIRDFRTPTLHLLDGFLSAMLRAHPDLLFVNDGDLWEIATQGFFAAETEIIKVGGKFTDTEY